MDGVNSCFLCKTLNLESNSVEVTGTLLENIIRIKVLGDLPVDFPHGGGKLCMCHDCLTVVEGIQSNLVKLKDRIVKRKFRVRYANVHFTKSQNDKMVNKGEGASASTGDVDECDLSDSEDTKPKSDDDNRRDSINSAVSSVSMSHSHVGSQRDTNPLSSENREVHIKVPTSVNATFIIVQSPDDITDHGSLDNTQSVKALLESKQVSDVISVPAFSNAHHVELKQIVEPAKAATPASTDSQDEPAKPEQRKKRRQSLVNAVEPIQKFQQFQEQTQNNPRLPPQGRRVSSPMVLPNRNMPQVPKIVTPDQRHGHMMDLSSVHHYDSNCPSPQLVPDESLQEYLNQRRRSYDVHYPAAKYDRHSELQHVGIIDHEAHHKMRYGNLSGGSLHLDADHGRFAAMPAVPAMDVLYILCFCSTEHQKIIHCDICGKVFDRKGLWKRHMLAAHQDQAFTCSQCGMKVVDRMSLHIHESREHGHIAGTVPMIQAAAAPSYESIEIKDQGKARKKMQYCEDCREHFTSKYDLLRHRVTTGHMGGAGGVCSDRGERLDPNTRIEMNRLHPSPYDALQMRKPPPLMRTDEGRSFRRMESLDDSNVPYVKSEMEKEYFVDRRRSAGTLMLDTQRLRRVAEEAGVYSADGQQIGLKVSSSSDKYDESP